MKKLIYLIVVIAALALIVVGCTTSVAPPTEQNDLDKAKPTECTTIQSGTLLTSDDEVITTGYDKWGYNYQALMFNGYYCDSYRDAAWCQEWKDVGLIMKWNDAWLSNKDCDGDGLLDRHYGSPTYIGSGAWLTNHQWGSYNENSIVDELDIGDPVSEEGHNLTGWSDPWTWGGDYGGGDDDTFRLLMGPGDGCVGFEDAYFTMNTNGAEAHKLILRHLDGSQNDNFDVYILNVNGIDWESIGSYASQGGEENWVTTEYTFSPRSGELKFKLVATGLAAEWCSQWGQVAFSWAQLEGTCYWDYFCKIVAAPADADAIDGFWYNADGTEIGPVIWNAFAIVQEVENDPCDGISGAQYISPAGPGLGKWESGLPEPE
ncbi:MAG TPA: hypothetical protein ENO17_00635 [Candidatus Atribacteria bacterium]|nr:hypothetical protein [Candidatus Atribacteria bacterium]